MISTSGKHKKTGTAMCVRAMNTPSFPVLFLIILTTVSFFVSFMKQQAPLGDPTGLRQALANPFSNAVKFTNSGSHDGENNVQ